MSRRLSLEFVRSEFEKEGYTLLSTEYKNSSQKLDVICNKGHHITTSWSNFNSGNGFNRIWDCGNTKWVLTT